MKIIIRVALLVVAVVLVGGGVMYWRGMIGHPAAAKAASAAPKAVAKATAAPVVLPSDAPAIGVDLDAATIDPFALRLAKVNQMAHKKIVTNAEYHDNDAGDRYFVAIVTSCKDLDAIWPIKNGVLQKKVEDPLHLKADFATFSFVEYFQQGQWGVSSCDGTT
jgi:hypothetical protein